MYDNQTDILTIPYGEAAVNAFVSLGDLACELKIKEDTTATSRCMPFGAAPIDGKCVCCGKAAAKLVIWGKAY